MWLMSLWGKPPPPSSMPAMYTSPVARSPVIWTLRMKVPPLLTCREVQVTPSSVEKRTKMSALGRSKSFQETYNRPKNGEAVLLSTQPDSRSSKELGLTQKWVVQLFGSQGVVDLNPPKPPPQAPSPIQTVSQLPVERLYRTTGSHVVLAKG